MPYQTSTSALKIFAWIGGLITVFLITALVMIYLEIRSISGRLQDKFDHLPQIISKYDPPTQIRIDSIEHNRQMARDRVDDIPGGNSLQRVLDSLFNNRRHPDAP